MGVAYSVYRDSYTGGGQGIGELGGTVNISSEYPRKMDED